MRKLSFRLYGVSFETKLATITGGFGNRSLFSDSGSSSQGLVSAGAGFVAGAFSTGLSSSITAASFSSLPL